MAGARTVALIVAGGSGVRMGGEPKQYAEIGGRAVLAHAIDAFLAHPAIDAVQVVIGSGQEAAYENAIGGRALPPPILGGAARRDSVANGLAAIVAERVLIHDAARPFLPAEVIDRLLEALERHDGAIPTLAIADTLVHADDVMGDNVARNGLHRVQTPQAFRTAALRAAHENWPRDREATDDAQMVRATGRSVAVVAGDRRLEKLTFKDDLVLAEAMSERRLTSRTGMGFDVHGFEAGDHVWMGGVCIPHDASLAGHSDADVGLHAITDAVLGAIAAGDIGDHFPPSDPKWRGAPSAQFLEHARDLTTRAGGVIDHVDLTIICEAPRIGPHRAAIRARIAELLRLPERRVSVKATTTERLGFTGRREGIAAQAIATVRMPEEA